MGKRKDWYTQKTVKGRVEKGKGINNWPPRYEAISANGGPCQSDCCGRFSSRSGNQLCRCYT
jgi:hypothetical protein